jgi:hypothetical protein
LARNCGYSVFPCLARKAPATPHGGKDASTDLERIAELWDLFPSPLIGVATGERSRHSVLDVDPDKSDDARAWWRKNEHRLPATRTYRTRRGGLHLWFQHAPRGAQRHW